MKQEATILRNKLERTKLDFEKATRELEIYEKSCKHDYVEKYNPIYHPSMTLPGDPPGTMGVDWRGPCYVPARTEERWERECTLCGKVEYTDRFIEDKKITKKASW